MRTFTQSAVSSATRVRVVADRLCHAHRHGIRTRLAHLVMTSTCCLQTDDPQTSHDLVVFRSSRRGHMPHHRRHTFDSSTHLSDLSDAITPLMPDRRAASRIRSMANWYARLPASPLTSRIASPRKNSLLAQDLP